MFLSFFLISFHFSSADTILSAVDFTIVYSIYVPKKTRGEPSLERENRFNHGNFFFKEFCEIASLGDAIS